jgi:hypothetical protein
MQTHKRNKRRKLNDHDNMVSFLFFSKFKQKSQKQKTNKQTQTRKKDIFQKG